METRQGKHKAGKVRMGLYVEPERKAIALLAADECHMTLTDIIWKGIESIAIGKGIIDTNGHVTKNFESRYSVTLSIVNQAEVNS